MHDPTTRSEETTLDKSEEPPEPEKPTTPPQQPPQTRTKAEDVQQEDRKKWASHWGKPADKYDFGFLPIPRHCRTDSERPFVFTTFHNWLFALGATITVANIYYAQPILVQLSEYFDVEYDKVTRAPSLIQAGYLCGIILISPLGDILPRRPLVLGLVALGATVAVGLALCPTFTSFEALHFLAGIFNVTPQILIPLAADLAPPARRASMTSIVLSGLIGGMVWGRLFAGLLSRFTGSPLHTYWLAAGSQYFLLLILWWFMPVIPPKKTGLNYVQMLWSMVRLYFTKPVLFQAWWLGLMSCTIMVSWWTTLTFLLSDTPFELNAFEIGLFGLTGLCAVAWAPYAGRLTDKMLPWVTSFSAIIGHLIFQCIALGAARLNLAPVIICCIFVDIAHQSMTVGNQARFFAIDPKARARINATYMAGTFTGQAIGSSAGPRLFLTYGWRACYAFHVALSITAMAVLLARGPHCPSDRWIGWGGVYSLKRVKPAPVQGATEEAKEGAGNKVDMEAQKAEGFMQGDIDAVEREKVGEETVVDPLVDGVEAKSRRKKGDETRPV
ncbi:hypothetical protein JCM11251_004373 [Rhodosporidiobolus azoricus]